VAREATPEPKSMTLPFSVASPADVGRLMHELELIDNALLQHRLKGGTEAKLTKTSRLMDQTVQFNKLNLLNQADRAHLKQFLDSIKRQAPVIHMSFSADPSPRFLEQLVTWLRKEIHPAVLLTIGLQPNIGAGCILRTTNKQFDFSLRQNFRRKRSLLVEQLSSPRAQETE
jgi:F0F1-type ATP synthase delta subunit